MGKILAAFIVVTALVAGAGMYYLQVYAFYEDVSAREAVIRLTPRAAGAPEAIGARDISAIDADSSPIRFRACFRSDVPPEVLAENFRAYPDAEPLTAPGWFDCFDAEEIGTALESGAALAFLGTSDITYGIDRVIAVLPDGRGFAWHQINSCGEVVFDGQPVPDGCPPPPESD
ncbi:histidine kinase [Meridianimarinicoccus roseus]|uniref:Histidine kinase n=1 Tax=Meridianimarinicoccus roseus TaxID=2072018 RepID=A0A2V2LJ17_9RHOB|nr:DUF6446 family protein [Meridianimarinicoccus roseus]PWR03524.1 histidine kinase [Meridianimarinicoccus roseus]